KSLRGYDPGKTQDMMLFGGALQIPLTRFPRLGYGLLGLGLEEGGRKIYRRDYEEGAVDLAFTGLGAYASRKQIANDFRWIKMRATARFNAPIDNPAHSAANAQRLNASLRLQET